MSVTVVVGAQWGDEGKGKVVDQMAADADIVVRFSGGANAGHTLVANGQKVITHLLPSGVLHEGTKCVLGDGLVVDVEQLLKEITECRGRGFLQNDEVLVSEKAHVVFGYHKRLEAARENQGGFGTTRRGIGPTYEAKAARRGIRICDLVQREAIAGMVRDNIFELDALLKAYGGEPFTAQEVAREVARAQELGEAIAPYVGNAGRYIFDAIKAEKRVLLEGAQGALLDIDHGTYPFVTCGLTLAGGACQGVGVGPRVIDKVVGIAKAYTTRVGAGPFPTELDGQEAEELREAGAEYGATTGRPRRCGWLDIPLLRLAGRVNSLDSIALTKLDVLSGREQVPICVAYELDGREIDEPPASLADWERIRPRYENLPGWSHEALQKATAAGELPKTAVTYVERITALTAIPISLVSVGPDRSQTVYLQS